MRRTAGLGLLAAFVIGWSWLRLEHGELTWSILFWSAAVGIVPALLPSRRLRLAAVPVAALLGLHHALGTARPGEAWNRIVDGFYLYYDVPLPFRRGGTSAHARTRRPRGVRLHPRDLARRRRAPSAARNRTAGRGSRLAGDAADELEHGGPRGGDPRGRARPPRRDSRTRRAFGRAGSPRPLSSARPSWSRAYRLSRRARFSAGRSGSLRARATCPSASASSGTRTTPRWCGPSARRRC